MHMVEDANLFAFVRATHVIPQPDVLTQKEATSANVHLTILEILIEKAVVILTHVLLVTKTVDQMLHACQMLVEKICVKTHVMDFIVDLIHFVKLLTIDLDVHAHQVFVVILILMMLVLEFQCFAKTAKTVLIIRPVLMDNAVCSVAMIMNVLLGKNVSTSNVFCHALHTLVVLLERLVLQMVTVR